MLHVVQSLGCGLGFRCFGAGSRKRCRAAKVRVQGGRGTFTGMTKPDLGREEGGGGIGVLDTPGAPEVP